MMRYGFMQCLVHQFILRSFLIYIISVLPHDFFLYQNVSLFMPLLFVEGHG
jgi:hypothetical protein